MFSNLYLVHVWLEGKPSAVTPRQEHLLWKFLSFLFIIYGAFFAPEKRLDKGYHFKRNYRVRESTYKHTRAEEMCFTTPVNRTFSRTPSNITFLLGSKQNPSFMHVLLDADNTLIHFRTRVSTKNHLC